MLCLSCVCGVCMFVSVCVCFGSQPKANVDKEWINESPVEERWKTVSVCTAHIFSLWPCLSISTIFIWLPLVYLSILESFPCSPLWPPPSMPPSHTLRKAYKRPWSECSRCYASLTVLWMSSQFRWNRSFPRCAGLMAGQLNCWPQKGD